MQLVEQKLLAFTKHRSRVAQTLVFCEMICRSWFIVLSFGHCIVHLPLDLRFWLNLWYLLTFPIQGENRNIIYTEQHNINERFKIRFIFTITIKLIFFSLFLFSLFLFLFFYKYIITVWKSTDEHKSARAILKWTLYRYIYYCSRAKTCNFKTNKQNCFIFLQILY